MANFVETATLKLNDQSSKNIRKINQELAKLNATAQKTKRTLAGLDLGKGLRIGQSTRSLTALTRRLNDLEKQLRGVQRASNRGLNLNVRANVSGLNQMVNASGRLNSNLRGVESRLTAMQRFWNRTGRAMNYAFGGTLYATGHQIARTAGQAPITMDTARARARTAGFDAAGASALEAEAERLSKKYKGVSAADILLSSVEAAGASKDPQIISKNMELIAKWSTVFGGALGDAAAGAEQARLAFKGGQIQGAAADPAQMDKIMFAAAQAFTATGYDVSMGEAVRALQQVGALKYGMSQTAMLEMLLARDEGGRMSTAEFRMAFDELIRGNLSDEKMGLQIKSGLRDKDGRPLVGKDFAESPLEFARDTIAPKLEKLGVNLNDMVAVNSAIQNELGFNVGASRLLTALVTQMSERFAERDRALSADPLYTLDNPTVAQQAQRVRAQFQNVSEQALGTFLPVAGAALDQLATSLSNIAEGSINPLDYIQAGGAALPVAIGAALEGMTDPATRPLATAGLALSGSAAALSTSAAALTAAAGAQGAGGALGAAAGAGGILGWLTRTGRYGRLGRGLRVGGPLGLGIGALGVAERVLNGDSFSDALVDAAPSVAGSIAGGILGSLVGPAGTVAGSLIGGAIADAYFRKTRENDGKAPAARAPQTVSDGAHGLTAQQHADLYFGSRTAMRPEDVMLHTQRGRLEKEIANWTTLIEKTGPLSEENAAAMAAAVSELNALLATIGTRANDGTLMPTPRPAYEPVIPVPSSRDAALADMTPVASLMSQFGNQVDILSGINFTDDFSGGASLIREGLVNGGDAVAAAIRSALSTPITVRAVPVPASPVDTGATSAGN